MIATRAILGGCIAAGLGLAGALAQTGDSGFPPPPGEAATTRSVTPPTEAAKPAAPVVAAKTLFGAAKGPAPIAPAAVGGYASGCLAGAKALPIDGKAWQAMRLNRNRNWGHPELVRWLERFAVAAQKEDGWPGLLVGDLSQPRGGPMLTGHASHQIGLDADIWLTPMPNRRLSHQEREDMSAVSMLAENGLEVDPNRWSDARARIIRRAAASPQVERIFVHPAIKKTLCDSADRLGPDRAWLAKVRPMWGHHYHFHVRLACPKDSANCKPQPPVGAEDGCTGPELANWFKLLSRPPKPAVGPPKPPPPPVTLAQLPPECRDVLVTGVSKGVQPIAGNR